VKILKELLSQLLTEFTIICILFIVIGSLAGCAETRPYASQYRVGDPCIKCGETFQQIPNFEYEAIVRKNRGEVW